MTRGTKRSARIIQLRRAPVAVLIREHTSPAQPQRTATEWREGPSTLAGSPERRARPGPHKSFTDATSRQAARVRAGLSDRSAKPDQNGLGDLGCLSTARASAKASEERPRIHLHLAWREIPRRPFPETPPRRRRITAESRGTPQWLTVNDRPSRPRLRLRRLI